MKNLKLVLSLVAVVLGLTSLSGCFPDVEEEALCENTCQYAFDGDCDDGGPNSQYSLCDCGTDCADCDERAALECESGSSSSSSSSSGSSSSGGSSSSSSGGSSSSSSSGGPVYGTVSDNDGNTYQTVVIGNQTWMAENMKTTRTRAGSQIPIGFEHYTSPMYQSQHEVLAVVWKDNDPSKKDVFGGLYNWYTAKRICPDGWHLPSKQEWETLNNYLGVGAAGKLKKTGGLWSFNQDATNESGFSAVPNDMAYISSGALLFHGDGHDAFWWSSYVDATYDAMGFSGYTTEGLTTYNTPVYHATVFRIRDSNIFIGQETKGIGTTCRCVED
jgi:uncharacterized protein (TIGR02145 family)